MTQHLSSPLAYYRDSGVNTQDSKTWTLIHTLVTKSRPFHISQEWNILQCVILYSTHQERTV